MEVGRLAEAAGDEKSAKPPMRFELPPGDINTKTDSYKILEKKSDKSSFHLPVVVL